MTKTTFNTIRSKANAINETAGISIGLSYLKAMPRGAIVHTILRRVSRSGMMRTIDVRLVLPNPENSSGVEVLCIRVPELGSSFVKDFETARKWGGDYRVSGCGMNMCDHLVSQLAALAHGDETYFKQQSL